jgi:hypothetical protein
MAPRPVRRSVVRSKWRSLASRVVRIAAAVSLPLVLILADAAQPSAAETNTRSLAQLATEQQHLDAGADYLNAEIAARKLSGLAGITVSPRYGTLFLFWHGTLPGLLQDAMIDLTAQGLTVHVAQAPYSQLQLDTFRTQITSSDPWLINPRIGFIAVAPDGSGLTIGASGDVDRIRSLPVIKASRIPITYVTSDPVQASRWLDTPPFYGGAVITNLEVYCSSGFPAHFSNAPSTYFMITASHCFDYRKPGQEWYTNGGLLEGPAWNGTPTNDGAIINLSQGTIGGGGGNYIYTQGTDQTGAGVGESTLPVVGFGSNTDGDYVITSGAFSGQLNAIRVVNNNTLWSFTGYDGTAYLVHGVEAEQVQHADAAGQGDSGGPVFVVDPNGTGAIARGIISAIDPTTRTKCAGVTAFPPGSPPRICAWRMFYPPIGPILSSLNVSLNT